MNFSAALFTRSSVKFSRNGDDAGGSTTGSSLDPDLEHVGDRHSDLQWVLSLLRFIVSDRTYGWAA